MARPRIELTAKDIRQARILAGFGLSEVAIAQALEISQKTLQRRKHQVPEFGEAIALGRLDSEIAVAKTLFELATRDRNLQACIWIERTRFGRTPTKHVEHEGNVAAGGKVEIVSEGFFRQDAENSFQDYKT